MIDSRLKRGLEQCISGGRCRFMSYGEFGREFELGDHARVWANKKLLDEVATACKEDPKNTIGPDLGALAAPAGPALDARSQ